MVGTCVQFFDGSFFWRPGGIAFPLVAARLEAVGLVEMAIASSLQPIVEPALLHILEVYGSLSSKGNAAQTVCRGPCPLSVVPGTKNNVVAVKAIAFFHVLIHQLRSIDIFLVKITAHV